MSYIERFFMRKLISGRAGFIGSHRSERLLNEGHVVICLDNSFTGSEKNIECLLDNCSFELSHHDIMQPIHHEADQICFTIHADDPQQLQPNINQAKEKLGWEHAEELETGMKRTIEYFAAQLSEVRA